MNSIFARDNVRTRSLWASSHGRKGIEPTRISVSEGRLSDTGHDVNLMSAQDKAGHLFLSYPYCRNSVHVTSQANAERIWRALPLDKERKRLCTCL